MIYNQTDVRLDPNQSENDQFNLNFVFDSIRFRRKFSVVRLCITNSCFFSFVFVLDGILTDLRARSLQMCQHADICFGNQCNFCCSWVVLWTLKLSLHLFKDLKLSLNWSKDFEIILKLTNLSTVSWSNVTNYSY